MDLVLRAYDHEQTLRAEGLPVQRIWQLLESGGMRDRAKQRPGLETPADLWAREAVVARLESLMQEGYGEETLARLRGGPPAGVAALRHKHWPPITSEEAVDLREDLVRYFSYGLWQAPEELVVHALALLTERSDAAFLLRAPDFTSELQLILQSVGDQAAFSQRFAPVVRTALARLDTRNLDQRVEHELDAISSLLAPAATLILAAREVGLRVIAYQDAPGANGLTTFLAADLERTGPPPLEQSPDQ